MSDIVKGPRGNYLQIGDGPRIGLSDEAADDIARLTRDFEQTKSQSGETAAFGASESACIYYPADTEVERASRAAYCSGAAWAADEITRLRDKCEAYQVQVMGAGKEIAANMTEIVNLRERNEQLRETLRYVIDVRKIRCEQSHPAPDDVCAKCRADAALQDRKQP